MNLVYICVPGPGLHICSGFWFAYMFYYGTAKFVLLAEVNMFSTWSSVNLTIVLNDMWG